MWAFMQYGFNLNYELFFKSDSDFLTKLMKVDIIRLLLFRIK